VTKTTRTVLFSSVAAAALAAFGGASAQQAGGPAASAGNETQVGEVVVTANKRAERIQDVASSVSAVSGETLASEQLLDIQDLMGKVPGLSLQQGSYGGISNRIILRGLNTGNSGATVATVIDDVPLSLSGTISLGGDFGTDIDSYDLKQIEVLRGPQGTLYGATAEGGLIKYVTNPPDPSGYHAGVELGVMNLTHGEAGGSGKGYVNIPLLNGTAAFRASGYYEGSTGWINDQLANAPEANSYSRYGGRASFLWKPTSDFTFRLSAFEQTKRVRNFDDVEVNGPTSADPFGLLNGYNANTFLTQPARSITENVNLNMEYDLHWAKIQSITAYGRLHYVFAADSTFYGYYFPLLGITTPTTLTQEGEYGTHKVSQEFRLSSEPTSRLFGHGFDWQMGAFYTSEDSFGLSHYVTRAFPGGALVNTSLSPVSPEVFYTNLPSAYQEFAAYADGTFHLSSRFDIEAGGRVFHNSEKTSTVEGGALFGFPIHGLGDQVSSGTSGTFSVAPRFHLTPNALLYVRVASGYRPGGPDPVVPGGPASLPTQFGSDRTINYEGGFKGTIFDGKLSVDVAGFYIDWSQVQVSANFVANGAAYPITQNVGSATSTGAEWTLDWIPLRGLHLGATGAYTDAHLTADAPGIYAKSGDPLPYVAKVTSTLSANYEWLVSSDVRAFIGGDWTYVGSRYSDFSYYANLSHVQIPAYHTFDLQAGLHKGGYGLEVYAKNIGDARGITNYSAQQTIVPGIPAPSTAYLIRPRTVGVRLTADF
jgi:iron complex outermembrane receptor protein